MCGKALNSKVAYVTEQESTWRGRTRCWVGYTVYKFCYLVSVFSSNATISSRLSKANVAFWRLNKCLWCNHGISIAAKVAVYRAMILTSLLYGCEGWTLYQHHIQQLDQFHMRCLRKIAHIKWQDHIPNTTVLTICNISGIEAFLQTAQLRWCGHVIRMQDSCIPKQVSYGQLHHGSGVLVDSTNITRTIWRLHWTNVASHHLIWKRWWVTEQTGDPRASQQCKSSSHGVSANWRPNMNHENLVVNHQQLSVTDLSQDVPF